MARILLLLVVSVSVGVGVVVQAAHKHHPKFPKASDDSESPRELKKAVCSSETERLRNEIIDKAKCGPPKEVFEYLELQVAHLQISPSAVWVKRCVGLCDYDTYGSKCVPLKKETKYIPVRIYNVKTNKESCSMYAIEEHVSCGCCADAPARCEPPRVLDTRKCACRCPNRREKRACRSKRNQIMRWNPSKCTCEEKLRIR